jgi:hypothetical protein
VANSIGSTIEGWSFSGLLTRAEIDHITIQWLAVIALVLAAFLLAWFSSNDCTADEPTITIGHILVETAPEAGLFEPKSPLPGNGISRAETKEAKTASKVQGSRWRDKISLNNPANSGLVSEN